MFNPISLTDIEEDKPVTTAVKDLIKANFDDHEARLENMEENTSTESIILRVNGYYQVLADVIKTTTTVPMTIDGVRILIDQAGTSGITEIDLRVLRSGVDIGSIFSVLPAISYTAGNDALSVAGILNSSISTLIAGDILRLDITSIQLNGLGFLVRIDWNT